LDGFVETEEGVDAVRRMFGRLRFDRRKCGKLLEALAEYQKVWDPRGKTYRNTPLHSWSSHYSDALRTFAVGFREPRDDGRALQRTALSSLSPSWRTPEVPSRPLPRW
jgi:hypothetical protein